MYESPRIAQSYSKFRPTPPEQLLEIIFDFSASHGISSDTVLDLACGSGQSTFPLCGPFRRTIGVDISQAQIDCALEKKKALGVGDKLEFEICSASDLPFADASVDLITCGVAWHWLDPVTVFPEIDRVLKRPGVLAVYCHGSAKIHQKECDKLYSDFHDNVCIWQDGPYGNVRSVCVNRYRDVKLPYPLAERQDDMQWEATMSLEDLEGFVNSWDSYRTYCNQNPGNTALEDMIVEMRKALLEEEEAPDEPTDSPQPNLIRMSIPFYLLLALKS